MLRGFHRESPRRVAAGSSLPPAGENCGQTGPLFPWECCWATAVVLLTLLNSAPCASAAPGTLAGRVMAEDAPVNFRGEVMAVLSKAGCNMGTCHGNKNGKGGLLLSLRGQDPQGDFAALVRGYQGRRIDLMNPEASLILRKATAAIPHGGGRRFSPDSLEYALLLRWLREGALGDLDGAPHPVRLVATPTEAVILAPQREVLLRIEASYPDGSRRDVTRLAAYETSTPMVEVDVTGHVSAHSAGEVTVVARYLDQQVPVRLAFVPERKDYAWSGPAAHNFIDEHVFAKLRALRIRPSPLTTDHVFLRRVHLDLLGTIPTAELARAFLEDARPNKRALLVESLLAQSAFADRWALLWSDLLGNEERTVDRKGVEHFHRWLRQAILENRPLDQFVREIVAARGSTYLHPQANFYRALRDPLGRAEAVAQVFLGTRLQCAKCHNHPFDRWTQDDYYAWAAVFGQIRYKVLENRRRDENDGHEFDGEQIIYLAPTGEVKDARTGRAAHPRFLGVSGAASHGSQDQLAALADWLTDKDNEQFAQAQVNRVWFHLMGRGIVDPIDDFRSTNPPSHPALLAELARDFQAHNFDLRHLVRTIVTSATYQLSSTPNETNREDVANFSHATVRRLSAEELADAIDQAMGTTSDYRGYPAGLRAGQLPGVHGGQTARGRLQAGDDFLRLFGKPPRLLTCECERATETTMSQAFELISGRRLNTILIRPDNVLGKLLSAGQSDEKIVDVLYWKALGRPPTADELAAVGRHISSGHPRREALEDVAWALLNSKEFLLRH